MSYFNGRRNKEIFWGGILFLTNSLVLFLGSFAQKGCEALPIPLSWMLVRTTIAIAGFVGVYLILKGRARS